MNKKNILAAILAALILTTACQSSGASNETQPKPDSSSGSSEAQEPNAYESHTKKDFGGRTFTLLDANQYPALHKNIPEDTMNGEVVNDALYERDTAVEEKFNVKIDYVQIAGAKNGTENLRNSVLAGDDAYQLCISTIMGGTLGTLALDGTLINLADNSELSLDRSWWSSLMYENLNLDNHIYFTSGDISPAMYNMPACVYLNKKLLDEYKITTDFYQLARDGKWTVDELNAISKDIDRDLNDDGIMHTNDDFFGFIHQPNQTTISMMLIGAGLKLNEVKGQQITLDSLSGEQAFNVYDKISSIKCVVSFDHQDDTIKKAFFNDRALSMLHLVDATNMLRSMPSDFSVLPVPKYDLSQEHYYSLCNPWTDAYAAIPSSADPEFAGCITEALARYSYVYIRPSVLDMNLKQKNLRDTESIEMLEIIYDAMYLDFNACYDFGGILTAITGAIVNDQPIASTIAGQITQAQTAADKIAGEFLS